MFLDVTLRRNRPLIEAAVTLHQQGLIPPNTYLVDLDAVAENTSMIAAEAVRLGVCLYYMTKQLNRNPVVAEVVERNGIPRAVAVDPQEAWSLHSAGRSVGHIGHLVQLPRLAVPRLLEVAPDLVTVFSTENARLLSEAARRKGRQQRVLLRVVGPEDVFFPGQVGGIALSELGEALRAMKTMEGIDVAGFTSFPCIVYDAAERRAATTPNLETLRLAAEQLRRTSGAEPVVNAPSMTSTTTLATLASLGVNCGEPGHALTGTTPLHAAGNQPERPALVYVSEVSHLAGGRAYTFGGGFYSRCRVQSAFVGRDEASTLRQRVDAEPLPSEHIDYYGTLVPEPGQRVRPGDTAVYAFRAQMFTSRAYLGLVRGSASGRPSLVALYDSANRPVGEEDVWWRARS